ncbi:hypothetical protein [Cerasicoccus frondis]|uniref:hypothetical protein n=1 Tax=Cerasicoccus frondis TaxID=490090 RepID=UPI0028525EEB|nr:hypothetical protein [Cerasicoccus frondis]
MGMWGSGNLENDGAQNIIGDSSAKLFDEVIELLKNPSAAEYDEYEYDLLFVKIEMITALAEYGLINSSPEPSEIQPFFDPYLKKWEKYFQGASTDEFAQERKAVIESSFENLLKVAEASQTGSLFYRIGLISEKFNKKDKN